MKAYIDLIEAVTILWVPIQMISNEHDSSEKVRGWQNKEKYKEGH